MFLITIVLTILVPMDDEIEESDEDVETESINNTRPEMECDGRRAAEHDYDYSSEINDGTQSDEDADVKQAITSGMCFSYCTQLTENLLATAFKIVNAKNFDF